MLSQLKGEQVYVYVDFVKSGRHFYTVKDSKNDFYLHRAIIRNREEEIPVFHKKLAFKKKEYSFETSVFADYQPSDLSYYNKDAEYWKINNFLRKEHLQQNVANYLKKNYRQI